MARRRCGNSIPTAAPQSSPSPRPKARRSRVEVALKSDAFYIGSLGSQKTHAGRVEAIRRRLDGIWRIHAPVGLAIGSISPAEITVSILAQITEVLHLKIEGRRLRRFRPGGQMKFGDVALKDAENAILAHSIRLADGLYPGRVLDKDDIAQRLSPASFGRCGGLEDGT